MFWVRNIILHKLRYNMDRVETERIAWFTENGLTPFDGKEDDIVDEEKRAMEKP